MPLFDVCNQSNLLGVLLAPVPPGDEVAPGVNVVPLVPGLGVGKYGKEEGPFVRYTPFESTNILIFPITGDGGVNSKNGSPDNPKSRKYTDILKHFSKLLALW